MTIGQRTITIIFFFWLFTSLTTSHPVSAHEALSAAEAPIKIGNGKVSSKPAQGYVYSCSLKFSSTGGGSSASGLWIKNGYWYPSMKPTVDGHILWPSSTISISVQGGNRVIRANNLPKPPSYTGTFPISKTSGAYLYDQNPNSIKQQSIVLTLPALPSVANTPTCLPMGMIGFTTNGAAIYNALDAMGRDAPAYEIQDGCNGHPEKSGQYHYHNLPSCFTDTSGNAKKHSDLVGYMLDGFPIYGLKGVGGATLTNADLDSCHGHTHPVTLDGKTVTLYHYHFTREYPYTIGCFKGKPVSTASSTRSSAPAAAEEPLTRQEKIAVIVAQKLSLDPGLVSKALSDTPPLFFTAAAQLGVETSELQRAYRAAIQQVGK